jgi:hypothetical protein
MNNPTTFRFYTGPLDIVFLAIGVISTVFILLLDIDFFAKTMVFLTMLITISPIAYLWILKLFAKLTVDSSGIRLEISGFQWLGYDYQWEKLSFAKLSKGKMRDPHRLVFVEESPAGGHMLSEKKLDSRRWRIEGDITNDSSVLSSVLDSHIQEASNVHRDYSEIDPPDPSDDIPKYLIFGGILLFCCCIVVTPIYNDWCLLAYPFVIAPIIMGVVAAIASVLCMYALARRLSKEINPFTAIVAAGVMMVSGGMSFATIDLIIAAEFGDSFQVSYTLEKLNKDGVILSSDAPTLPNMEFGLDSTIYRNVKTNGVANIQFKRGGLFGNSLYYNLRD